MNVNDDRKVLAEGFDEDYYKQQLDPNSIPPYDPILHYLKIGAGLGMDPNADFSTKFYIMTNDDVREANINPFLHYLQFGRAEGRKPSLSSPTKPDPLDLDSSHNSSLTGGEDYKLLQEEMSLPYYREKYPDLDAAEKNGTDLVSHFMVYGWREGRDPHPQFSTEFYLHTYEDIRDADINPFLHYIRLGRAEGRAGYFPSTEVHRNIPEEELQIVVEPDKADFEDNYRLLQTEMSVDYYRERYPDLQEAEKTGTDLIEHFIVAGWREGRDPHPQFSTEFYLNTYEDIRAADTNPFLHYIRFGREEGRTCSPPITFRNKNANSRGGSHIADLISSDVDIEEQVWAGYQDVKQSGFYQDSATARDAALLSFVTTFHGMDPKAAAENIIVPVFSVGDQLDVSIVIPCLNQPLYTLECISSVVKSVSNIIRYEIIVVDNGSTKEVFEILTKVENLKIIRNNANLGFGPACNQGAEKARGTYIMVLNNDAQLAPGCLEALIEAMQTNAPLIGAAVPKVLSFNGLLQEAGCRISSKGEGQLIGLNDDHRKSMYGYGRWIEYGSAVALLISRQDFVDLSGFDDIYAPAYYEDVDLGMRLKAAGKRIRYVPEAVVAHHLSQTSVGSNTQNLEKKMELVVKNQQIFRSRWQSELLRSKLRLIAFYLPQYHPIPENDRWWGAGFTEWTNVVKATANYRGHRQPRRPAELGYYDLRAVEVMEHQAKLAQKYGISGFCYYYYSFSGKRLLEFPLERMLSTGRPNQPFCLCWANENWTRSWDGMNKNILIAQDYNSSNDLIIIRDLARYFASDTYIKIDGKPLILVYRVKELPLFTRTAEIWRNYCRANGVGEIIIAAVESFELSASPEHPNQFGCDLTVEFPPHGMVYDQPIPVETVNPSFAGSVRDYRELARSYMQRQEPGWTRIRSVLAGWDNTPRRQNESLVLENATPGAFQAWLEWTVQRTLEMNYGDEQLVFINAWNEWCEGSYLEPDADYGHAYLQAVRNALAAID